jgi:hypothetical protein
MDKEKLEKYLSEKYTQEEGQTCKVIIKYFQYLGKTDDGDDKISFEGVIRRRGA